MQWRVTRSTLRGTIVVPPSKSHTIRALLIATLAAGRSRIINPLLEGDGNSALQAARGIGARIEIDGRDVIVDGIGGDLSGGLDFIDAGNSGTSTRLFCAAAALGGKPRTFDGDASLRTRVMKPLFDALTPLGVTAMPLCQTGDIPFTVKGPLRAGATSVQGVSSQFVSALLLVCPLVAGQTTIDVPLLNEKPYVRLTLWWLDKMGIPCFASDDLSRFIITGSRNYHPITERIPGDFSGATFGAVAAALTGGEIELDNIDFSDPQGDKGVFDLLALMGAKVEPHATRAVVLGQGALSGRAIDLNSMPDALPALAVLGCMAEGTTRLMNVKQARIKETDRIAVMTRELTKMGAHIQELPDGLVVSRSRLTGCRLDGHGDHRVVMALALAGMIAEGETIIDTAEAAAVTYPSFAADFRALGANIEAIGE
jgi:3-phosphoshikimate 1-carboxyvinyltransferase